MLTTLKPQNIGNHPYLQNINKIVNAHIESGVIWIFMLIF